MGERLSRNNKGQVTIFIVVAMVIVGLGVAIYFFYPQLSIGLGLQSNNPTDFIQNCIEEKIEQNIQTVALQGGSLNPENYFTYKGEKLEYLCYTNQDYEPCVVQQPFLQQHIEEELTRGIEEYSRECFNALETSFEKAGYEVDINFGETSVELFPGKVISKFNHVVTLQKESANRYKEFSVIVNNNLYELVNIASSIVNFEASYGDSETTLYMNNYHDLKVEKKKQSDGTTVYILTNRDNENKFQFASRSVVWPSGYGV